MPRVTWSETLAQDESSASVTSKDDLPRSGVYIRKSLLKPPTTAVTTKKKSPTRIKKERKQAQQVEDPAEAWREQGKLFRARLIMKDEESGGDAFVLSNDCHIEKYYSVAERVLEQFLTTTVEDKQKLVEAYLVGNRLVKFMSRVLPTHSDYFSADPHLRELRVDSQSQLVELLQYLEELALIIDEEEYQEFIRKNLSVEEDEDDPFAPLHHVLDQSTESVSSYELASLGDSFEAAPSDAPAESTTTLQQESSSIHHKQEESSQSWDDAFTQLAPQIAPQEDGTVNSFDAEWSLTFPNDFDNRPDLSKINSSSQLLEEADLSQPPSWPSWNDEASFVRHDYQQEQAPPEKMTLSIPALREDSPKSILEMSLRPPPVDLDDLEDNTPRAPSLEQVEGYLQHVSERPPPSDYSVKSGEEEELSLTGSSVRRRRHRRYFKGCVKCLLE